MAIETYVMLPYRTYETLQKQAHQHSKRDNENEKEAAKEMLKEDEKSDDDISYPPNSKPPSPQPSSSPKPSSPQLPPSPKPPTKETRPPSPLLSNHVKNLTKKKSLSAKHFEKLVEAVKKYEGVELNIPNTKSLIKNACGQSKRKLENEELFYMFLCNYGLAHFILNKHKLRLYVPNWFRIG